MVRLEYYNGVRFIQCGDFRTEAMAWISLGGDNKNYRVIEIETGDIISDNT